MHGRAIASQEYRQKGRCPECRVLPTAISIAEQPALFAVDGDDGSHDQRHEQQGCPSRINAKNETSRADQFGRDRDGLVTRSVFPTVPVTVEYDLTALGHTLTRTLDGFSNWAMENIEAVHASQQQYDTDKSIRK